VKRFLQYLTEAPLSPKHKKELHLMMGKEYPEPTKDDRIEIPLHSGPDVTPHPDVQSHLEKHGYQIKDYKAGIAYHPEKKQEIKIGKALEKTKAEGSVVAAFRDDPRRALSKKADSDLKVVITKHPHDIANKSTNQHWTSCMDMDGGSNRHYIPADIRAGAHEAYLVHKDDHNLENPLGRISLKPFHSYDIEHGDHTILRPEGKTYGAGHAAFHKTVQDWAEKTHPAHPERVYTKDEDLYNDDDRHKIYGSKVMDRFSKSEDFDQRSYAAQHGEAHHIDNIIKTMGNHPYSYGITKAIAQNPHATPEHLRTLAHHERASATLMGHVVNHPNAPDDVIDHAIDRFDTHAIEFAKSPNLKPAHIDKLLAKGSGNVARVLGSHHNPQPHHFDALANHEHWTVRQAVAENPRLPVHHQEKLAEDEDSDIRESLTKNPNLKHHVISKLIQDPVNSVIQHVAEHAKVNDDHVKELAKHPNNGVRFNLVNNPHLKSHHLDHIIDHSDDETVHNLVLENPLVTKDHIHKMIKKGKVFGGRVIEHPLTDESHMEAMAKSPIEDMRFTVARHRNAPEHVLKHLSNDSDEMIRSRAQRQLRLRFDHDTE